MKKLLVTILSLCILLIGCTHTESNNIETDFLSDDLILQEQISPNKDYVTEEMGGQTPSEDDQLAIADVTLKSESNTFSERKINFSNGAIEILNDTMNKNMK